MCDPTTLMIMNIGVQAIGASSKSNAEAAAMRGNAEMADMQAALDDERAADAIVRGGERIFVRRLTQAQIRGRQKAVLAARGLSISEGSAFDILEDTDYLAEIDVNTIQTNAEREAWGFRSRAKVSRFRAGQLRKGIPSTLMLGQVQALGGLVSGGAQLFGGGSSSVASGSAVSVGGGG